MMERGGGDTRIPQTVEAVPTELEYAISPKTADLHMLTELECVICTKRPFWHAISPK